MINQYFWALPTLAGNSSRKDRKEIKNAKNSLANFVPLRPLRENPVLLRRAILTKQIFSHDKHSDPSAIAQDAWYILSPGSGAFHPHRYSGVVAIAWAGSV